MSAPPVSVVMPVRDGMPWLDESVRSIVAQTFTDFELVVVDDASTDGTADCLATWRRRDPRIRVVRAREPLGLVGSSNAAVAAASGALVARMDADDVSDPERLARQVAVHAADDGAALVGTLMEGIDHDGRLVRPIDRWRLVRRSVFAPFPHGSIVVRRSLLDRVGGYRHGCEYWEDLDLYLRLARVGRVLVIPEALYRYRFHVGNVRRRDLSDDVLRGTALMIRCASRRQRGEPYDDLVAERANGSARDGAGPGVLAVYAFNAPRIWSATELDFWRHLGVRDLLTADPRVLGACAVAAA
ncbi:glycosyltransferase, partial [Candidatus Binatia bacterium]|nr:glycosyltransferase [Candidatus Binatia bacterium]